MRLSSAVRYFAVGILLIGLAGCKTAEEQAQEYYEDALALVAEGDSERAVVQLRNVFELDANHRDARMTLARIQLESGAPRQAYRQFLRVAEQYPDDVESRLNLAKLAFDVQDWAEFQRHGQAARELAPDSPAIASISLGLDYQSAVADEELTKLDGLLVQAEALFAEQPDDEILIGILLDGASRDGNLDDAVGYIDRLIARSPDIRLRYDQKLAIIARKGVAADVEQQLLEMADLFPSDNEIKASLVRYYLSEGDLDKTEAFLRSNSDPENEDPGLFFDLVRFLSEVRGEDAARAELSAAIEIASDATPYKALIASMDFSRGDRDQAIATMEQLVVGAEPNEQTLRLKIGLAKMLIASGNDVGARVEVEQVLAEDGGQVDALKMRGAWLIDADDTDGAISTLRLALDNAPDDAEAMTLMATAYTRAGSRDLARDFYSLAVEASGNAPAETIRYARILIQEERYLPAEDILIPALRNSPGNVDILGMLGEIYVAVGDEPRATQVVGTLQRLGTAQAADIATSIAAAQARSRGGPEEAIAFLEQMAANEDATLASKLLLIRAQLSSGQTDAARAKIDELTAEFPDNLQLAAVRGVILEVAGDIPAATAVYRNIVELRPQSDNIWLRLSLLSSADGDPDTAFAIVEEGLSANPDSAALLWAKASFLENRGDIDETIEIYEALYERSSGSLVVANNLASMLSTYRNDAESIERAWVIARRLEGTDQPPLQDTYGWILHLRGESETALTYLEPAAAGLEGDAMVRYHLAAAYAALDRTTEALETYRKAIEIAGPTDTRPQFDIAKSEIERLEASATE